MRAVPLHPRRQPARSPRPMQTQLTLGSRWQGPTIREFIDRVEREFGAAPDLTGFLRDSDGHQSLKPGEVRVLCDQIGVPAEDFGVEP